MLPLAAVGALTDEELIDVEAALGRPTRPAGRARRVCGRSPRRWPRPSPRSRRRRLRASLLDAIATTPQLAPEAPAAPATEQRPGPGAPPWTSHWPPWCRSRPAGAGAGGPSVRSPPPWSSCVVGVSSWPTRSAATARATRSPRSSMPTTPSTIPMPGELPGLTIVHSADAGRRRAARRRRAGARGRSGLRAVGDPRRHARALRHVPPRRRRAPERLRRRPRPGERRACGRSPRSRRAASDAPTSDILNATA